MPVAMSGRSTPQQQTARHSRNISQLRQVQINGVRNNDNVLASLRATQIVGSKPFLPAELLAMILEYLPVPELMLFARVSHRTQEMVYDDTRWIQKLKSIGVWNEGEARQRFEDAMKRKAEAQKAKEIDNAKREVTNAQGSASSHVNGERRHVRNVTLFDAGVEEERVRKSLDKSQALSSSRRDTVSDGFDDLTISGFSNSKRLSTTRDRNEALTVLDRVRSIRGHARQEFGKVHGALGHFYNDLTRTKGHSDATIFRTYKDPEQQAQILSSLKRFSKCDCAQGWQQRELKLDSIIGIFENAAIREFEQGYAAGDVDGRMRRYANVLATLNGGNSGVDAFISNHPVMTRAMRFGSPMECLEGVTAGNVDLTRSQAFFEQLARVMIEQGTIIDKVFPPSVDVLSPFLSRLCDVVVSDYLTTFFDEAHEKGIESYVKSVSGTFEQALRFVATVKPTKASPRDFLERAQGTVALCYEKHVDLYLVEELAVFRAKADAEVGQWEKMLSDQEASAESFFMSNINRQAAKSDFLSSFKKVVMLPVTALPAMSSTFATTKPVSNKSTANLDTVDTSYHSTRPMSSTLMSRSTDTLGRSSTPQSQAEAPTSELAAKAAIMNSRLEGIKSLFSIEVALSLTHLAKACIERAAVMVRVGGSYSKDVKTQCETIFVTLIDVLGDKHIRNGFDKALIHLGNYDPHQVRELKAQAAQGEGISQGQAAGVEPLVTFLELVNVGDLIQQMIDVFYAQELVAAKLTDGDDFLNPAVKAKKRFEQMLDERVAAGLNKGIDVLMDEVEFLCATTQTVTDFNPGATGSDRNGAPALIDIGPSLTAKHVIDMVSSHTSMLVGSTDKNMLDVFTQEVGLRLFGALCKHFKRQRVSVDGAIKLISDINHYSAFVSSLRQKPLLPYFQALREMSQIYLVHIDPPTNYFMANSKGKRASFLSTKASSTSVQAKELATIIADSQRYHGIFGTEEVYEFAQRRADWYLVKSDVERAMYGIGCSIM